MDDLVLAAYDTARGSARWRQLSAKLAEALDSKNIAIFLFDEGSGAADLFAKTGARYQGRLDAYLAVARKMVARHRETSRSVEQRQHEHVSTRPAPTRVAQWNSASESVADCYLAGMAFGDASERRWFCIGVDATSPMAIGQIHEKVGRALPHFCRAAEIDRSLRAAAQRSSFSDAVFDRLPFGLLQFDRNATLLYANAEAERISRLRDGFVIASRKARAGSSADDAVLQNAVRESISTRKVNFARWLSVKRGKGRRPYGILVTGVSGAHDVDANAAGCILFITDPERPSMFNPEAIADAFDLTTAEARVVARLAMGISLPDIASDLKVSINTVRTLLARAMGKTATNTQVALVRMVLTTFSLNG